MFIDALLTVSDAQALTGTSAILSTNTIDLGNTTPKRDIGTGTPLRFAVGFDVAMGGTTPAITIEVVQSANADLSSSDVIGSSGSQSAVAAGKVHEVSVDPGRVTKRYLGLKYTMTGTSPTATVTAALQPAQMSSQSVPTAYARGYSV
jgi:hypothetical protein